MSSILTITFNPCIDVNTTVPSIRPDVKLRCSTPFRQPGGGGINVARVVKRLGGDPTAIYLAGGDNGRILTQMLQAEGVRSLVLESDAIVREDLTVIDNSTGKQFRFIMPGPTIDDKAVSQLPEIIDREDNLEFMVVSGSFPPGLSTGILKQLAEQAARKGIKVIVDSSGDALRCALSVGVYLVKPSVRELISLSGLPENFKEADIDSVTRQWVDAGHCEVMVVSLGAAGALLATAGETTRIPTPSVRTVSTVGAGDSMVAGIVWSLSVGKTLEEAVEFGCACGAATTMAPGTSLCSRQDVESILAKRQGSQCLPADGGDDNHSLV
jgi:6-phosphofructokinase 2